ncbi:hypothetical protein GY45DRAFT_1331140 [Cubamyces sp. BRFM 1775]|nr:hypothetical protein GY45DRAFT_1331140 [Cubamyces sp. BRFM 1775]
MRGTASRARQRGGKSCAMRCSRAPESDLLVLIDRCEGPASQPRGCRLRRGGPELVGRPRTRGDGGAGSNVRSERLELRIDLWQRRSGAVYSRHGTGPTEVHNRLGCQKVPRSSGHCMVGGDGENEIHTTHSSVVEPRLGPVEAGITLCLQVTLESAFKLHKSS